MGRTRDIIFLILIALWLLNRHADDLNSFVIDMVERYTPRQTPTPTPTKVPANIVLNSVKDSLVYVVYDFTACCVYGEKFTTSSFGSGVIINKKGNTYYVLTSRHVVDCVFSGDCVFPYSEAIKVRTQDGKFHEVTKVSFAPGDLDLAMLEFVSQNYYPNVKVSYSYNVGDRVFAIGYPVFEVETAQPVFEFSIKEGKITKIYTLLTHSGFSFRGIESNAITRPGASGGGLFNEKGELIGIITWGNNYELLSIGIDVLKAIDYFEYCPKGSYPHQYGGCCPYGTIAQENGLCYRLK